MDRFGRLRDESLTDVERALLDSANEDVPSPEARQRALLSLGLSGGAALSASAAKAAGAVKASGGGAAAGAGAAAAKATAVGGTLVIAKWLGAGVVVGTAVAGSIAVVTTPGVGVRPAVTARAPATPAPLPTAAVAAPPRRAPSEPAAAAFPEPTAALLRPVDEVPSAAMHSGRAISAHESPEELTAPSGESRGSLAPPSAASTVVEEVASLDRARAALAAGDADGALARLASHRRRFASGTLEPEAVLLEVRALRQLGRASAARATAERYLTEHADSSLAARLRAAAR